MHACAAPACKHDGLLGFLAASALRFLCSGGARDALLAFSPPPVGLGRGAQAKADQGRHLFKAIAEFVPDAVCGEDRRLE